MVSAPAQTDDLLDFGGLFTSSSVTPDKKTDAVATAASLLPPISTTTAASASLLPPITTTGNAVNSAFDDLLGLEQAAPLQMELQPLTQSTTPRPSTSKKAKTRPWIKGTVKASSAKGKPHINWNDVTIYCRAYSSKGNANTAATVHLRVVNHGASALTNVTVTLVGELITLGTVDPHGGAAESSAKAGPFLYDEETSLEVRGKLEASGSTVPVKLTLPASLHLSPLSSLTQDVVMGELGSGDWASGSAKVGLSGTEVEQVLPMMTAFLRAGEVEGGGSGVFTLAAVSKSGNQVRILVKVSKKEGTGGVVAKVDVKCKSDERLCKSLVSDLKKLHA